MPAPVVSASSSILGWRRREPWAFQPAATNAPTSWSAVGLPSGLSINSTTGLISGSVETAGVYVATVSATNADGTGTMQFVIGISPEIYVATATGANSDFLSLLIRLPDCRVALPGDTGSQAAAGAAASAPLLTLTEGDERMLSIQFVGADNAVVDPDPDTLRLAVKAIEPEAAILDAADFEKTGSGATAAFLLPVAITGPALASYLSENEADRGTFINAIAEIEWTREITFDSAAKTLRATTLQFPIRIYRDLADN